MSETSTTSNQLARLTFVAAWATLSFAEAADVGAARIDQPAPVRVVSRDVAPAVTSESRDASNVRWKVAAAATPHSPRLRQGEFPQMPGAATRRPVETPRLVLESIEVDDGDYVFPPGPSTAPDRPQFFVAPYFSTPKPRADLGAESSDTPTAPSRGLRVRTATFERSVLR